MSRLYILMLLALIATASVAVFIAYHRKADIRIHIGTPAGGPGVAEL